MLLNLRERNISDLHSDQRALASSRVARAYRLMYDKEECERYENAITELQKVKQDLHNQAEDIYSALHITGRLDLTISTGELLLLLPDIAKEQQRESRETSTASSISATGGRAYMHAFREAVSRQIEKANSDENVCSSVHFEATPQI